MNRKEELEKATGLGEDFSVISEGEEEESVPTTSAQFVSESDDKSDLESMASRDREKYLKKNS